MTKLSRLSVSAALCLGALAAQAQLPATSAGRQFSAWLEALNSGDRTIIEQFTAKNLPGWRAGFTIFVHDQTGGLEAEKVESSI